MTSTLQEEKRSLSGYVKAVGMDVSTGPPSLLSRLTHQGMFDSRLSYFTHKHLGLVLAKILTDITSPDSIEAWLGLLTN
jgi:hypothetical protein